MGSAPWYILGAGSIGCLLAYHFNKLNDCRLLLRDEQQKEHYLHAGGIKLEEKYHQDGHTGLSPTHLSKREKPVPYLLSDRPKITQLIITTKAHQTETALLPWLPFISDNAPIILLQNGMGVIEKIRQHLPSSDPVLATTTEGANRVAPFSIHHAGRGTTWLGRPEHFEDNNINTVHSKTNRKSDPIALIEPFLSSGFKCEWDRNIQQRLWQKLAVNCAINGLTIVHNCKNGELLTNPKAKTMFNALILELEHLYQQQHPELAPTLRETIYQVTANTSENICSSLQDWRNKRPTELPFLNGFLIDYAAAHQIDLPMHQTLMDTVSKISES